MLKGIYTYESQNVPNPVSEGVLLKELLCEVLQVTLGEGDLRCNRDADIAYCITNVVKI